MAVPETDRPRLSAIVVSFNAESSLARCLEALVPQARAAGAVEIVVVRARPRGPVTATPSEALRGQFPDVCFVEAPDGCTVPRMRTLGVARSAAPIVALIEDDCVVQPGWVDAALRAHVGAGAAIGGAVEPGPFRRGLDWAVFFCDYGRFMLPIADGPAAVVAGNNMSFKRAVLAALPETASDGLQEVFVCQTLRRRGAAVRSTPSMIVVHAGSWSAEHVTRVPFHHARAYAGARLAGAAAWRRVVMSGLALGLPVLKVARVSRDAIARGRRIGPLVRSLPWIVVLSTSWSLGECAGYLFGPGDSLSKWQ